MGLISVAEAAEHLGVGVQRVHQRIADGSLRADRIGSQWVVDERSLAAASESASAGRPLSMRSAWALIALSQDDDKALSGLHSAELSRARERLRRLLALVPAGESWGDDEAREILVLLRSWLRNRAERRPYRASPRDLPDLRDDSRAIRSGLSHSLSDISSGDYVEAYVRAADVAALEADYLLSAAPDEAANVVLHVVPFSVAGLAQGIPHLRVAADLAEHRGPREEHRAVELVREAARSAPVSWPVRRRPSPRRQEARR